MNLSYKRIFSVRNGNFQKGRWCPL